MSRCERCGGKDHTTEGHDAAFFCPPETSAPGCSFCGALSHTSAEHLDEEEREANRPRPGRRLIASTAPRPLAVEALLPFQHRGGPHLVAEPQKPFLPRGLMLWDVGLLNVEAALVGPDLQLVAVFGRVPARWFATQQSFDAVMKAQRAGEAAAWGHWTSAYPGMLIRLDFDGPADRVQALMWGFST